MVGAAALTSSTLSRALALGMMTIEFAPWSSTQICAVPVAASDVTSRWLHHAGGHVRHAGKLKMDACLIYLVSIPACVKAATKVLPKSSLPTFPILSLTDTAHRRPEQAEASGKSTGPSERMGLDKLVCDSFLSPALRLVSTPSQRLSFAVSPNRGLLTMATDAPNLAAMRACMQQKDHISVYSAFVSSSTFTQLEGNDCAHLIRTFPSTANMRSVTANTLTYQYPKG